MCIRDSTNRALRQRLHEASIVRGSRGGDYDNREIISKIMTCLLYTSRCV